MKPSIILSLGRPQSPPPNSIVVDFKNRCFWRNGLSRPKSSRAGRPSIYGPAPFRLMAFLLIRAQSYVTHAEISEYLWGDDPTGGPENTQNYVAKRIEIMRSRSYKTPPLMTWLGCHVICEAQRGIMLDFDQLDSAAA